jgi:hypothetical protein
MHHGRLQASLIKPKMQGCSDFPVALRFSMIQYSRLHFESCYRQRTWISDYSTVHDPFLVGHIRDTRTLALKECGAHVERGREPLETTVETASPEG